MGEAGDVETDEQGAVELAEDAEIRPGARVGRRYELQEKLGQGATSVVWRAAHVLLTREYAIKFLEPQAPGLDASSADELLERFGFEAQVSARLGAEADNIVAVHDAGLFGGRPYMVMDLVRGQPLAALLRKGKLPLKEVVRMAADVGAALEACHRERFAHRDLKPANILAVEGGRFKLADFGLAKLFGEAPAGFFVPRETTGSMLIGTPAYMCPEAISAERTISGRWDVWALSVTLYECLTQHHPFKGEGWPGVAVSIMKRNFRPPSEHDQELAPFDELFNKAFAQAPEDRFLTVTDLVAEFTRIAIGKQSGSTAASTTAVAGEFILQQLEPAAEPAPRIVTAPPQKRSFVLPALLAFFTVALLVFAASILTRQPSARPSQLPTTTPQTSSVNVQAAPPPVASEASPPVATASLSVIRRVPPVSTTRATTSARKPVSPSEVW